MRREENLHRLPMLFSVFIALILDIVPLPQAAAIARPDFMALAIVFWSVMAPRAGGLLLAFVCGLLLDAIQGVVLGQHALAMSFAAYLAIKLHLRIRVYPIWHQAFTVLWILLLYQFALFWIDGTTGHPVGDYARWISAFTSALLWPLVAGLLGNVYQRS